MPDAKPSTPITRRIFCNECHCETNHVLQAQHKRYDSDAENGWWEESGSVLWTCAGCEAGTMERTFTSIAMGEDENGEPNYSRQYFPPRATSNMTPKTFRRLPKQLLPVYREAIEAFNRRLHILCAAGLRALVEGICNDKEVGGEKLWEKINGLAKYLPVNIVEHLHGFRFMGNDAVHQLEPPDAKTLAVAIEVSEDLLNFLYDLDYKVGLLPRRSNVRNGAASPSATGTPATSTPAGVDAPAELPIGGNAGEEKGQEG